MYRLVVHCLSLLFFWFWVHAGKPRQVTNHCVDQYVVLSRYCSPGRLYRLCHAFLVIIIIIRWLNAGPCVQSVTPWTSSALDCPSHLLSWECHLCMHAQLFTGFIGNFVFTGFQHSVRLCFLLTRPCMYSTLGGQINSDHCVQRDVAS